MNLDANREVIAEASAWFAQLQSGNLSAADLSAFREWMQRSPRHAAEIRAIAEISSDLSDMTELSDALERAAGVHNDLRKPMRSGWIKGLSGAVAAFCVIIAAVFMYLPDNAPELLTAHYETAIGQYQTVTLEDGTTVRLNTNSELDVLFKPRERQVRLLSGEALFDVASDPTRPFTVYSGETAAKAVGTAFVVRLLDDSTTELSVIEGVVAFSKVPLAASASAEARGDQPNTVFKADDAPIFVQANQALKSSDLQKSEPEADRLLPIAAMSKRDIQRKLSWTEGLFDFSQTPLTEVIAEIERHNDISISIADPALDELRFGGIFRTGDVEPMLEAFESVGVLVERNAEGKILLRSADDG